MRNAFPAAVRAAAALAVLLGQAGPAAAALGGGRRVVLPGSRPGTGLPLAPAPGLLPDVSLPAPAAMDLSRFADAPFAEFGEGATFTADGARRPGDPAGALPAAAARDIGVFAPRAEGAAALKAGLDASYDGAADWTRTAPDSPLPPLEPVWRDAQPATERASGLKEAPYSRTDLGEEKDLTLSEALTLDDAGDSLADVTGPEEGVSFGRRERFRARDGVAGSAAVAGGFAWVREDGRVGYRDQRTNRTYSIGAPSGGATAIAASQDKRWLYVAAGGSLQRWDLETKTAAVIHDPRVTGEVLELAPLRSNSGEGAGAKLRTSAGTYLWTGGRVVKLSRDPDEAQDPALRPAGAGLYLEPTPEGTRLWSRGRGGRLADMGLAPFAVGSIVTAGGPRELKAFAATADGLVEWDLAARRFRLIPAEGVTAQSRLDVSADGTRLLAATGAEILSIDLARRSRDIGEEEAKARLWSEANPMFISDGRLFIGDFSFPVRPAYAPAPEVPGAGLLRRLGVLRGRPPMVEVPPVGEKEWKALNLPSNKLALYRTLKGFTLGQNVLYIGETGGGKTWMAERVAKLIGRKLYMVSFTEHTRNVDLLYRNSFGETGKGRTGKTLEVVLQWLDDPEGGVLLLDEMHKPLEGIAALNNVLVNLKYQLSGRDFAGDRSTHFVIGTMNPVKPPYKGEPPSGELSARFGTTLPVSYLPAPEEAALLSILEPAAAREMLKVLISVANELRRLYPDVLPLPVSSRTLVYMVEHMVLFPGDDPVDIFKTTYNPGTIVEDPSVIEAVAKALEAHDFGRFLKKKPLTP